MFQDEDLVSLSGAPIYRYQQAVDAPTSLHQAKHARQRRQLRQHIEQQLGAPQQVFTDPSTQLQILHIPASFKRPLQTLVSLGMSLEAMQVPARFQANPWLELMLFLPPDWRLDQAALSQGLWSWPLAELFFLAQFPHKYNTWLGWGHTLPNGEPIEAFAANTDLTAVIMLPPIHVPADFYRLQINPQKQIDFLAVVPIYTTEMRYKLRLGSQALLKQFDAFNIDDVIDIKRANVIARQDH